MWPLLYNVKSIGRTDVGLVRENNEDYFFIHPEFPFFTLADGMGGHNAGEIAAKEAILFTSQALEESLVRKDTIEDIGILKYFLKESIQNANKWVYHLGKKHAHYRGMGTTLCALLFHEENALYAHVGDSRIYCYRQNELIQLTKDHSLEAEFLEQAMPQNEVQDACIKNVLTRAIGTSVSVDIDMQIRQVLPKDIFMLCSDGLTDCVSEEALFSILEKKMSLKNKIYTLVDLAKEKGGRDNISIILTEIL